MLETFYYLGLDFLAFGGAVDYLDDDKSNDADDDNANPKFDDGDDGNNDNIIYQIDTLQF